MCISERRFLLAEVYLRGEVLPGRGVPERFIQERFIQAEVYLSGGVLYIPFFLQTYLILLHSLIHYNKYNYRIWQKAKSLYIHTCGEVPPGRGVPEESFLMAEVPPGRIGTREMRFLEVYRSGGYSRQRCVVPAGRFLQAEVDPRGGSSWQKWT
jgi:hypothetical protein